MRQALRAGTTTHGRESLQAAAGRDQERVLLAGAGSPELRECEELLGESGYDVQAAGADEPVFDLLRERPADVVVLDAGRDPEGAVALARRLKGSLATADLPVLAMVPQSVERSPGPIGSVVDDCLRMPVSRWELLIRVRSMIRLHRQRRELQASRSLHGDQTRMWEVMLDFTRAVGRIETLHDLLEHIVRAAAELTSSRRVSLMLPDEHQQCLTIAASVGLDRQLAENVRVPIGEAIAGQAFRTGRPVTGLDDHEDLADRPGFEFRSFVSMPMTYTTMSMVHQRVGVLNVSDRYGDRPFEEWELEFVDLLAGMAGSAIDDIHARSTRETLLRIERDLQLARSIQRSTFPSRLPELPGFELAAWSEPAEHTAGDTYDVIGCLQGPGDGSLVLSTGRADRAYLLLADATGHGIGPALSVTQVRAMLRMAVRMKPELGHIARHLNEQLNADLPGGRFVTAWLAELDAQRHTLTSFSAGQAPILRFSAADDRWEPLAADTMPFGILPGLEVAINAPVTMEPGDIVAVISDGVVDAVSPAGEKFGLDRLLDVLHAHRLEDPHGLQFALQSELAAHRGDAPSADDETGIILKRRR